MPIDGAIVVNLNGFVDLVDAVGGLWIDIPFALHDAHYALPDGSGYIVLNFQRRLPEARTASAPCSTRGRATQDSDYGRMRRQQRVIVALARQLDPIAMLPRVPELLEIARDNLWTTIQPDEIADLAELAARVDKDERPVLPVLAAGHPAAPDHGGDPARPRRGRRRSSTHPRPRRSRRRSRRAEPKPCPRP